MCKKIKHPKIPLNNFLITNELIAKTKIFSILLHFFFFSIKKQNNNFTTTIHNKLYILYKKKTTPFKVSVN